MIGNLSGGRGSCSPDVVGALLKEIAVPEKGVQRRRKPAGTRPFHNIRWVKASRISRRGGFDLCTSAFGCIFPEATVGPFSRFA